MKMFTKYAQEEFNFPFVSFCLISLKLSKRLIQGELLTPSVHPPYHNTAASFILQIHTEPVNVECLCVESV